MGAENTTQNRLLFDVFLLSSEFLRDDKDAFENSTTRKSS